MSRRKSQRMAMPTLSHDEAVQYLVEYRFGRLAPAMNAAVEAHVRSCRICQRQGLSHAATEKRDIARQIKRIRPGKRRITRRGRNFIVLLALLALAQLAVYQLSRSQGSPFTLLFGGHSRAEQSAATATPTDVLAPRSTLDVASRGTVTVAVSPDGKTIAGAMLHGTTPVVVLWSASGGAAKVTLSWAGTVTPGSLAWSPDGKKLAATDGTTIGVWTLPATTPDWTAKVPTAPAMRSYSAQSGVLAQSPSASSAFANGTFLLWGADGHLTSAPAGAAGPSGVVAPGAPLIGLWQSTGTHLYSDGRGGVLVGISASDVAQHEAALSWSPDSQYVLWGVVSQHVALSSGGSELPAPNPVVAAVAQSVAHSNGSDALIWFSPDGRSQAQCNRTKPGAALQLYDIASGNETAELPGVCAGLSPSSLTWVGSGGAFALATAGHPIGIYSPGA